MLNICHVAVLIPARDEERLLPRCIASVLRAVRALPPEISHDVVVVADSSVDRTRELAEQMLGSQGCVLSVDAGNVGKARAVAAHAALTRYTGPHDSCWLANTDADCEVPQQWLLDQVALANAGAQAIAGIVEVDDFSEHHPGVMQRFRETYSIHADGTHPHVHGANLGMRADAYLRVGGWSNLQTAEDHDLWNRLAESEYSRRAVAGLKVITSGRRLGRAPLGFAGALAAHNEIFV